MPYVYMLRCRDGSLYTGCAKDLTSRIQKHQDGRGAKYTRARRPVTLVWHMETDSWSLALKEEYRIKQLSRALKEQLISG